MLRKRAASALSASQAWAVNFTDATRQFIDAKSDEWRNLKHRQQWINTLATYADPTMGKLLVEDIRQEHVMTVLLPIWRSKTETASRLRGRIEQVLDWATVRGFRSGDNPARWKGHLSALLPQPGRIAKVEHHDALPIDDMPAFMCDLRRRDGTGARAREFLILTAARSGEIRGVTWSEIDLGERLWTIPGHRMKAGREHRVPLSAPAFALLNALHRIEGTDLVFPGRVDKPLSDMTLTAITRRIGVAAVPHGFRSTFRDWAADRTRYPAELAEMALANSVADKVEAAYRRGDMLARRAEMMNDWADFCLRIDMVP